MTTLALIVGSIVFVVGGLIVIFPDFFAEMGLFSPNQLLYWLGFGKTLNVSKFAKIFTRIIGSCVMLIGIVALICVLRC